MSNVYGQEYFEGEINYEIEYQPVNSNIPKSFLENEIGSSFKAYIKEDKYAMKYNSTGQKGWMKIIVRLDQGYTYTEFEKSNTIIKTKFGNEHESLIEFKRNTEDKKEILGEQCESVTINYETKNPEATHKIVKGKYYFNPKYRINPELYKNYTDGFWNQFFTETESVSVRNEIEYLTLFKVIQEAKSIEKREIPSAMFEPNESKLIIEE